MASDKQDESFFLCYSLPGSGEIITIKTTSSQSLSIGSQKIIIQPFIGDHIEVNGTALAGWDFIPSKNHSFFGNRKNTSNSPLVSTPKTSFIGQVNRIQEKIKEGVLEKAVASRIECIQKDKNFNSHSAFQKMAELHPGAFCYWLHSENLGEWMGATPELLASRNGDTFKTMALAGTIPCGQEVYNQWSAKEKEEQAIVLRNIVDLLEEKGLREIQTGITETVRAGKVMHLRTNVEAKLGLEQSAVEIATLLHPTPAVCGMPRKAAKTIILETESHKRELYTGFIGIASANTEAYFVNLRCMQILNDSLVLYLGAGITADSKPEAEWEETKAKALTLKSVIGQ